jgi:hypothetical protein
MLYRLAWTRHVHGVRQVLPDNAWVVCLFLEHLIGLGVVAQVT